MPKIQIIKNKKLNQLKYMLVLPFHLMQDFATRKGDELMLKSVVGNEITFKYKRKTEIEAELIRRKEIELEELKRK